MWSRPEGLAEQRYAMMFCYTSRGWLVNAAPRRTAKRGRGCDAGPEGLAEQRYAMMFC